MSSSSSNDTSFTKLMKQAAGVQFNSALTDKSANFFRSAPKKPKPKPLPKDLNKELSKLQIRYVAEFINSVLGRPKIQVLPRN